MINNSKRYLLHPPSPKIYLRAAFFFDNIFSFDIKILKTNEIVLFRRLANNKKIYIKINKVVQLFKHIIYKYTVYELYGTVQCFPTSFAHGTFPGTRAIFFHNHSNSDIFSVHSTQRTFFEI